jgi:hypothetical protein
MAPSGVQRIRRCKRWPGYDLERVTKVTIEMSGYGAAWMAWRLVPFCRARLSPPALEAPR